MPIERTTNYNVTLELSEREFALLYLLVNQNTGKIKENLGLGKLSNEIGVALFNKLICTTELYLSQHPLKEVLQSPVVQTDEVRSVSKTTKYTVVLDLSEKEFALLYTLVNSSMDSKRALLGFHLEGGLDVGVWQQLRIPNYQIQGEYLKGILCE